MDQQPVVSIRLGSHPWTSPRSPKELDRTRASGKQLRWRGNSPAPSPVVPYERDVTSPLLGSARPARGSRLSGPLVIAGCCVGALVCFAGGFVAAQARSTAIASIPTALSTLTDIDTCPLASFENGRWERKAAYMKSIETLDDLYAAFDVTTCAAGFQPTWNMGVGGPPYHHRVDVMSWQWVPHSTCDLRAPDALVKLQSLVDGGLLLVGDSRSRQHFFSLSCELAPHVRWSGGKPPTDGNDDGNKFAWRMEQQHLYLDPDSPLVPRLRLPAGFDYAVPLVTYEMAYLPLSRDEMRRLPSVNASIITAVDPLDAYAPYTLSANRSLDAFADPAQRYKTLVFSTGAHFSNWYIFPDTQPEQVIGLLRATLRAYFPMLAARMTKGQRVLVRAAAPGQTACAGYGSPMKEVPPPGRDYNFGWMPDLNDVTESEVALLGDPRFSWIGMERIGRLRPDAHLPNDCVHFAVGTGVIETWSRYIWHRIIDGVKH